jgi:hypothetical protein
MMLKIGMRQRGRKSLANLVTLSVDGAPPRLEPPANLQDDERALFTSLVAACDPRHFVQSDLPLLVSFVQATLLAQGAVHDEDLTKWEKAVRVQATLATRLRLAPQARSDPKTVARQQPTQSPPPWMPG